MFAYRHMRLLVAAALCAGSVQVYAADGAGDSMNARSAIGKSFGRLELSGQLLSPQRFGPSSAFFSAPLGEEIASPPVRSRSELAFPEPAASPMNARAAVTSEAEDVAEPKMRANTATKRAARPVQPRAAAKRPPSNPMNSYARDTREPRRQAWPCTGGGICAWR